MALSHKNSGNEYLVHTDMFSSNAEKLALQQENGALKAENATLKQNNTNLKKKYNDLAIQYNDIITNGTELQWLKINHYFLHQHIENMSDSEIHKKQIEEVKQKAWKEVETCKEKPQAYLKTLPEDRTYLKTLVQNVQSYILKHHHDNLDKLLFTWTGWIQGRDLIPLL